MGPFMFCWGDQRNGEDDTNVWLSCSKDNGETWTQPIRVNDNDESSHQFFPWFDVDQSNGHLYFVFYDRRNYEDKRTDVFFGQIWEMVVVHLPMFRVSESPFIPTNKVFFGDYNNISVHQGVVRPIWTRLENGKLSVWTDITPSEKLFSKEFEVEQKLGSANDKFSVNYSLNSTQEVEIVLVDSFWPGSEGSSV